MRDDLKYLIEKLRELSGPAQYHSYLWQGADELELMLAENEILRGHRTILRDSAKDVIAWCDKSDSGCALYCIDRLRNAIVVSESVHNAIVTGAREDAGSK